MKTVLNNGTKVILNKEKHYDVMIKYCTVNRTS